MFEGKALLERYLANEALSVTQAAEAHTLIRVIEFAGTGSYGCIANTTF